MCLSESGAPGGGHILFSPLHAIGTDLGPLIASIAADYRSNGGIRATTSLWYITVITVATCGHSDHTVAICGHIWHH